MTEKLIIISSDDKDPSESESNSSFTVNLKETYNTQNIGRILVKSIQVPNVFYNIRGNNSAPGSGSVNNVFTFREGAVTFNAVVPEGQYILNDYVFALQTAINLVSGGAVTVTVDPTTNRIVFTDTVPITILPVSSGNAAGDVCGILTEQTGLSVTADALPDLSGIDMVFLHSRDVSSNFSIDGDAGMISAFEGVSLHDTQFGANAYYQSNDVIGSEITYDKAINLSRIRIVLRDNLGNKLNIGTSKLIVIFKVWFAMEDN